MTKPLVVNSELYEEVLSNSKGDRPNLAPTKTKAKCPNEKEGRSKHHAFVKRRAGRKQFCVCESCGESFEAWAKFADVSLEYTNKVFESLKAAHTAILGPEGTKHDPSVPLGADGSEVYIFDPAAIRELIVEGRNIVERAENPSGKRRRRKRT